MKSKTIIAAILTLLTTLGSDCANDSFVVALNIPITGSYALPSGGTSFNESNVVNLETVAGNYDGLNGGTIYDIRIKVSPARSGRTLTGTSVRVNGLDVCSIQDNSSWDHFTTERSVLSDAALQINQTNLDFLVRTLFTKPLPTVTLSAVGTMNQQSASGDTFTVTIYAQANGTINTN